MVEAEEINVEGKRCKYGEIVIAQVVCVLIILIALLAVKYFFADTFSALRVFYEENICDETDVGEVTDGVTYEI